MDTQTSPNGLLKQYTDDASARKFLESVRWPDGPVCPHCGLVDKAYRLESKPDSKNKVRAGLCKCAGCRQTFTATVGTIFEDSHIPLSKWLLAIHFFCASKKGISAHQLHRMLGVTYKSAWFMAHRIRYAMSASFEKNGQTAQCVPTAFSGRHPSSLDTKERSSGARPSLARPILADSSKLSGIVEVDETYIGGKLIGKGVYEGRQNKTPVVSLVERRGQVRSFHVDHVTAKNLKPILDEHVRVQASLMTDDAVVYSFLGKPFASHDVIKHSASVYSRRVGAKRIHTNTVEGFFSLLKRGIIGTFHHVSKQHLHRYLSEFDFRYNARKTTDIERALLAVRQTDGKRLMYRVSGRKDRPC